MKTVDLELEPAARGEQVDRYYAQVDDWFFEVHVPKGEQPEAVNVRFRFESVTKCHYVVEGEVVKAREDCPHLKSRSVSGG